MITPNEMLCPKRLRAVNYCDMPGLEDMDRKEYIKLVEEEDQINKSIFFPVHLVTSAITLASIVKIFFSGFYDVIYAPISFSLPLNSLKKLSPYIGILIAVMIIDAMAAKLIFRPFDLHASSPKLQRIRLIRLQDKINSLDSIDIGYAGNLKSREINNLKEHFQNLIITYR